MCYMSYVPTCQILELRRDFPAKLETGSGVQLGGALEGRAANGGRQAAETKRDLANPSLPKVALTPLSPRWWLRRQTTQVG